MNGYNNISNIIRELDISNVFIYVGDAVRDDYLPDSFKQNGTYVRTIAGSIHSPASFASIATGNYSPTHGVHSFNDRLSDDSFRLFDISNTDSRFLNSIFAYATEEHGHDVDPIHSVLNTEPDTVESPFDGLEPPFIAMERGPGGHAPYGEFTGTATEYFRVRGGDRNTIVDDYERSIELDIEWFNGRVQELEENNLLEDTLVIYTSDHGELLGEGGVLGHNDPMRPELVYVPTVFHHPSLPTEQVTDTTYHHADLLPTILTALSKEVDQSRFDGFEPPESFRTIPRPCFWQNQFLPDSVPGVADSISYEGVWNHAGGRVRTQTNRRDRYAVLIGKLLRSSKREYMRRNLSECIATYWWSSTVFGTPSFDEEAAADLLDSVKENAGERRTSELSEEEEQHLRDLGYLQ